MFDLNAHNRKLIAEFRESREKGDGRFAERRLLLLTTTGARSGQRRTTPMMYVPDGNRLLVIASNNAAPRHPDWYHNLIAHSDVVVEVKDETFEATAVVTEGAERQRLWASIVDQHPFFAEHQAKVTRQIPVVALERQES